MNKESISKYLKWITYIGVYGGLLMPLIFIPKVIFPFVFSKLIFLQVLIGLTFPSYLFLAYLKPKFRPPKSVLYFSILAYFIALLLSVITAVEPMRAWWGNQERMNGLFTLLHLLAWLTMAISVLKTKKDWWRILNYQVSLGFFMAIVTLLQKPFPKLLIFKAGPRVGGLLDNPIYQGAYQLFILFFLAWLWTRTKSLGWRVWYAVIGVFSILTMFATGSRGPMMGLLFGVFLSTITIGFLHKNKKLKTAILGVSASLVAFYILMVSIIVYTPTYKEFAVRVPSVARVFNLKTGTAGRFIAWQIAWDGFLDKPLTGWGLDNFHDLFNKRYNPKSLESGYYETWFDRAHNTVMDVLSMTGAVGFLTFLAIWVSIYYTIIQARRKNKLDLVTTAILIGLPAGYFLQNLFVFDHPAMFSMSYLLYAWVIAISSSYYYTAEKENLLDSSSKQNITDFQIILFVIIQIFFTILVYITSIIPFHVSSLAIKANNYFYGGHYSKGLDLAKQIHTYQTPYLDEQTFLWAKFLASFVSQKDFQKKWPEWKEMFDLTQVIYGKYLSKHNVNAHDHYVYANLLQSVGFATHDEKIIKEAIQEYEISIKESPKRQQLYFSYARLLTHIGQYDKALELYKQAVSFDEDIGESWWYIATTYLFNKKDPQMASKYFKKALNVKVPFKMRSSADALIVAESYEKSNDIDGMKKLVKLLPTITQGSTGQYLRIALITEKMNLISERDMIIEAILQEQPGMKVPLQAFIDKQTTSVQRALDIYKEKNKLEK